MDRQLTLRGGRSYTIGSLRFEKDKPRPINDDRLFYRLIHTGMFEENPPLCYYYIRRRIDLPNKANRLTQIDGKWYSFSPDSPTRITRYQWSKICGSGQYEIVPPLEIMDNLVKAGKEDFSLLIERDMGAGDIIIVTDLLYNLRLRYPKANITFATSERYLCLADNLDFISNIVVIGTVDSTGYDVSVNLCGWSEQYPLCAKVHRSDLFGMAFSPNFPWVEHKISLKIKDNEQDWFDDLNSKYNPDNKMTVAIQPYGSCGHRSIDSKAVNHVIDELIKLGFFVYVYGQNQWPNNFCDRENMLCLWEVLNIRQVMTLISNVNLLVCPDSSGYHMAAAFDIPSVVIFTTIHEGVRVTYYPHCYPLRASEFSCSPCWDRPCGAPEKSNCVQAMTGERIMVKVEEVILNDFGKEIHPPYHAPDWN